MYFAIFSLINFIAFFFKLVHWHLNGRAKLASAVIAEALVIPIYKYTCRKILAPVHTSFVTSCVSATDCLLVWRALLSYSSTNYICTYVCLCGIIQIGQLFGYTGLLFTDWVAASLQIFILYDFYYYCFLFFFFAQLNFSTSYRTIIFQVFLQLLLFFHLCFFHIGLPFICGLLHICGFITVLMPITNFSICAKTCSWQIQARFLFELYVHITPYNDGTY